VAQHDRGRFSTFKAMQVGQAPRIMRARIPMRRTEGGIVYAPTDLVVFLESPFASWMDRLHLESPGR
jgi:hypothetical protein